MEHKEITLKVSAGKDRMKDPEWRKLTFKNNSCPRCGGQMLPVLGYAPNMEQLSVLYAHCLVCREFYLAE